MKELSTDELSYLKEQNIHLIHEYILIGIDKLGFKPKTVSTGFTYKIFTEDDPKRDIKIHLINNMCVQLLLEEIRLWIWDTYKVFIKLEVCDNEFGNIEYGYTLLEMKEFKFIYRHDSYITYIKSLEEGIIRSISYIKQNNIK